MRRAACLAGLALLLALSGGAAAGPLKVQVAEVARSVDLSRGGAEFLTVVIEITGADPERLRSVQPLRDDFHLAVGKSTFPCRWLRGGSVPEDPGRLRFTLGFDPPRGHGAVDLHVNLPRLEGGEVLEVRLAGLETGSRPQPRQGEAWSLTVVDFSEQPYVVPALPPKGQFISKFGPADHRVFRKGEQGEAPPDRVLRLIFTSRSVELYDPTLDVSGHALVEGVGAPLPLLSAAMRREPSRAVKDPPIPPIVTGEFHFRAAGPRRPVGAVIRLHRRPPRPGSEPPVVFRNLPLPAR